MAAATGLPSTIERQHVCSMLSLMASPFCGHEYYPGLALDDRFPILAAAGAAIPGDSARQGRKLSGQDVRSDGRATENRDLL